MATRNHVVGAGVQIRGALQGSGELTLRGSLAGELLFAGAVRVEHGGRLEITEGARGSVESLVIAGTGSGEIRGSVRLTVQADGVFEGALVAPVVVVHEGARVRGWIETTGTRPDAAPAPDPRLAAEAGVAPGSAAHGSAAQGTSGSSTSGLSSTAEEPEAAEREQEAAPAESNGESAPRTAVHSDDAVDASPAEVADESDADDTPATNSAPAKGLPNRGKRR